MRNRFAFQDCKENKFLHNIKFEIVGISKTDRYYDIYENHNRAISLRTKDLKYLKDLEIKGLLKENHDTMYIFSFSLKYVGQNVYQNRTIAAYFMNTQHYQPRKHSIFELIRSLV